MQATLKDLGRFIEEADRSIRRFASEGGQCAEESLAQLREGLERIEHQLQRRLRRGIRQSDRYVREHPWQTMGIVAGVAFVLGALAARRD